MINCPKCGNPVDEAASFCPYCHEPLKTYERAPLTENESLFINNTKRFLRYEKIGWLIGGIVFTFAAIMYMLAGFSFGVLALVNVNALRDAPQGFPVGLFVYYIFLFAALALFAFLPLAIINFVMLKRVNLYINTIDTDVTIARKRGTSIGMIVFCYFFSNIALVFFLINFIRMRKCGATLDSIELKQK